MFLLSSSRRSPPPYAGPLGRSLLSPGPIRQLFSCICLPGSAWVSSWIWARPEPRWKCAGNATWCRPERSRCCPIRGKLRRLCRCRRDASSEAVADRQQQQIRKRWLETQFPRQSLIAASPGNHWLAEIRFFDGSCISIWDLVVREVASSSYLLRIVLLVREERGNVEHNFDATPVRVNRVMAR